jgi:hypothetical protein
MVRVDCGPQSTAERLSQHDVLVLATECATMLRYRIEYSN